MARIYNFSAGPAVMPEEVLLQAQTELFDYHGTGMSIMEMSHRGKTYGAVHAEAQANLRELLGLTDDYAVLFLQGGASLQFAMLPMNFLSGGGTADYVNAGAWGAAALKQARLIGDAHVAADCEKEIPTRVPSAEELKLTPGAAYLHLTSNETISGAQWKQFPACEAPLVADMSSDILSRPFDASRFALIYAGAQKNLGPAGVTLVVIRKDFAARGSKTLPTLLRYLPHIENDSMVNTPPCFGIYLLALVTRWLKAFGPARMYAQNRDKAARLYQAIDASGFYRGTARAECRSDMNVVFRLPTESLEERFCTEASAAGFSGLKGHRSVGGIRASIYNAFPVAGVDALIVFMREFERRNG